MHRAKLFLTVLLTSMLLIGAVAPQSSVAQSSADATVTPEVDTTPRFVLRPSDAQDGAYFTVNARAGSTTELTATIGNVGEVPLDLRTFSSDAVVLVNGGFGVKDEDAEQTGPTTWIDWEAETFSFEPGEGIERSFTVTIPEGTAPGEYIAGISIQTAEPIEIEGSTMFDQIIRKAVAVFIIVEGDTTASYELGEPEIITTTGGSRLEVPVANTGDVLVKPAGTITLTDSEGREVFSTEVTMGSVYAGFDTVLAVPLDDSLAGQEYQMQLTVTDESSGIGAEIDSETILFSGEVPEEAPVQIAQSTITPMPDEDEPVYVSVDLTIVNSGAVLNNANVVLHVHHDGELVEDFSLGSTMNIASGESTISQRYIPADGFSSGEWSFMLSIETVDPQSGATTLVLEIPLPDTITVP